MVDGSMATAKVPISKPTGPDMPDRGDFHPICPHCHAALSGTDIEHVCTHGDESLASGDVSPTVQLDTSRLPSHSDRQSRQRTADALVGKQLSHYQIERLLGRGGMGSVFLARHLSLQRPCAIKILHNDHSADGENLIEAFLAEARAAASLVHPHVVTLHNIGQADGFHFIEMEYVEGNSLMSHVDRGPVEPLQATQWMLHISAALSAAHQHHLIHRDIKPANVLVAKSGLAKLADFGLAKRLATDEQSVAQSLCGTPSYMAPELFGGIHATTRSDIYAMGITYYVLLAGRLPLSAPSINELLAFHDQQQTIDVVKNLPQLPKSIQELLARAVHRQPAERFKDAAEMQDALQSVFGGLQPLRTLVDRALVNVDHVLKVEGDAISVIVALGEGRKQTVKIEIVIDSETSEEIVRVFSICGRAIPEYFERALNLNATISHGSIGIQLIDSVACFVMTSAYPRTTCDPEEIRSSVIDIARHSDEVERLIGEDDQH
jgi:serine/threonine-protein kinase